MAVADLDGDTVPDVVTANEFSDDVSVLLGNGDGTFQAAVSFAAGDGPQSVAVADLDGDTVPDLVTANTGSDDVSVLLGNGDGSFQAAVSFAAGNSARLRGRGRPRRRHRPRPRHRQSFQHDVSVLLGNAEMAASRLRSPSRRATVPASVAVADLDGDTAPDLVTANVGSDDVSVLLGQRRRQLPGRHRLRGGRPVPDPWPWPTSTATLVPDLVTANRDSATT